MQADAVATTRAKLLQPFGVRPICRREASGEDSRRHLIPSHPFAASSWPDQGSNRLANAARRGLTPIKALIIAPPPAVKWPNRRAFRTPAPSGQFLHEKNSEVSQCHGGVN
jgi:hypothetical protein